MSERARKSLRRTALGEHIPTITLDLAEAAGDQCSFYKITLTDVLITSVSPGGSAGDARPTESIALNYGKIKWEYTVIDEAGRPSAPIDASWDVELNKEP